MNTYRTFFIYKWWLFLGFYNWAVYQSRTWLRFFAVFFFSFSFSSFLSSFFFFFLIFLFFSSFSFFFSYSFFIFGFFSFLLFLFLFFILFFIFIFVFVSLLFYLFFFKNILLDGWLKINATAVNKKNYILIKKRVALHVTKLREQNLRTEIKTAVTFSVTHKKQYVQPFLHPVELHVTLFLLLIFTKPSCEQH